ncbi:aromatic ring-hydroxylating dioxygenase subunit alpha [Leptothoe kymatousa]|uniref:Aromatic ring-hydroxylating dioxygenase subunit alpha n=1 Tax=Leptothoe kymatousa TAU-MAC 1615 TaxID=2364775 RepID=A0ABS5Y032_9CYAN|nr:aromatic ring-hydroxylating dioxygenase subunit alpha [Leptothoe kymatousa]MBT9311195.1 aromatic ring-hydroxylating dioxygenase subunit alpha [Leptothoe kymatousa TAU-MAC 1615]
MEASAVLKGQPIYRRARAVGINPNYWYPIFWADQVRSGEVVSAQIWDTSLAVYRDAQGIVHTVEDACPHKGVELHRGEVHGNNLVCPYHGWEFDSQGSCVGIPYFPKEQKLPCAQARTYPTQEAYGIIWVFPGAVELAEQHPLPEVPQYGQPGWFMVRIPGHFQAHFSICNENTMDVFHGFLHKDLQGWYDPKLLNLKQDDHGVAADYQVSYDGFLSKLLGLGKKGSDSATRTVSIRYRYPHYATALESVSSLYLMRLPVGPQETKSFSLLFLKLPLPQWLLSGPLARVLEKVILNTVFIKFLHQDVEMMESEQRNYSIDPKRNYVEVNPAIIALQRVIVGQYENLEKLPKSQQETSKESPIPPSQEVSNGMLV